MMSPIASWPMLFNRLKANVKLTKTLPEELWSLQPASDDSCQDKWWLLWQTLLISPKGKSLCLFVARSQVSRLVILSEVGGECWTVVAEGRPGRVELMLVVCVFVKVNTVTPLYQTRPTSQPALCWRNRVMAVKKLAAVQKLILCCDLWYLCCLFASSFSV